MLVAYNSIGLLWLILVAVHTCLEQQRQNT